MTIRYEANPPKIIPGMDLEESISTFITKIKSISTSCDAIHLTENVLGNTRISPITIGARIKKEIPDMPITVSLRVRDKDSDAIQRFVAQCITLRFSGILVLMGDPSPDCKTNSRLIPSRIVQDLRTRKIDSQIDLYLSIPNAPNFSKINKKIDAKPKGFMTQVVGSAQQVQNLVDNLPSFSVIPIILFPSIKNEKSAKFLNLNLDGYRENFADLVSEVHNITNDILITSPNDFNGLKEFLEKQL